MFERFSLYVYFIASVILARHKITIGVISRIDVVFTKIGMKRIELMEMKRDNLVDDFEKICTVSSIRVVLGKTHSLHGSW